MIPVIPLSEVRPRARRVAIGEFDGVHLGHREVIRGSDTVVTFDPHPRSVIAPAAAPKLLTTLVQKAELVAELGVTELVVIPFDTAFSSRTAQQFVDDVLVAQLGATRVSVGENFRFGHRTEGGIELLRAQSAFETHVATLVEAEGEIVSSTHIRGLIMSGKLAEAARFLGTPFELRGEVVAGDRRGRELGFPTANQVPDNAYVCPDHGIYATLAGIVADDGAVEWHPAATNVGVRPTFTTGRGLLIETYLIDWQGEIYGRELRVRFLRRLRGERRFESVEALVEQMGRDVREAAEIAGRSATFLRRT